MGSAANHGPATAAKLQNRVLTIGFPSVNLQILGKPFVARMVVNPADEPGRLYISTGLGLLTPQVRPSATAWRFCPVRRIAGEE
jgi:hypothetical protein